MCSISKTNSGDGSSDSRSVVLPLPCMSSEYWFHSNNYSSSSPSFKDASRRMSSFMSLSIPNNKYGFGCFSSLQTLSPSKPTTNSYSFAIFNRGECAFLEKVEVATQLGYDGLIVINSNKLSKLSKFGLISDDLNFNYSPKAMSIPIVLVEENHFNDAIRALSSKSEPNVCRNCP